jgi:hypothetical protein
MTSTRPTPTTPSPTTLRARTPEDLLAAVPCILGFRPADSVVMLTFGQPGRTFHARVDLPTDPLDHAEAVAVLLDPVLRHGVGRVAFLLYTTDPAPAALLADALATGFAAAGVEVVEVLRADGERWFPLAPWRDPTGDEGRAYDDRHHPFLAQSVLEGRVTHETREDLAASLLGTDEEAIASVARAAERLRDDQRPRGAEKRWVGDAVRRFLDGGRLDDEEVARLLVACRDVELRDEAWLMMDRQGSPGHVELWRDVVRRCPTDLLAPPAALLAFAAWLSGHGALAWCALDRCAEADPGYRMAGLVAGALEQALPPSAWSTPPTQGSRH